MCYVAMKYLHSTISTTYYDTYTELNLGVNVKRKKF